MKSWLAKLELKMLADSTESEGGPPPGMSNMVSSVQSSWLMIAMCYYHLNNGCAWHEFLYQDATECLAGWRRLSVATVIVALFVVLILMEYVHNSKPC